MAAYKASYAQIKAIFALGKRLGMDTEDLHAIAYRISGAESIKALTSREAWRMIEELKMRAGEETQRHTGERRLTDAQRRKIYVLTRELGWLDQPERLRGWLKKYVGVDEAYWLTPQQAGQVIDGLKAMRDGGRAERRMAEEVSG